VTFLADAHQRGVLRQAGAVYQFRHLELQRHLALARYRKAANAGAAYCPADRASRHAGSCATASTHDLIAHHQHRPVHPGRLTTRSNRRRRDLPGPRRRIQPGGGAIAGGALLALGVYRRCCVRDDRLQAARLPA